jgi:hypothetical protein
VASTPGSRARREVREDDHEQGEQQVNQLREHVDSGSTSRGKYTFFTRSPLPTIEVDRALARVLKNCHSR